MRFILILLFFSVQLAAQEANVFSLKPALGVNGCQIHGDNYSGYDKFGLFAGLAVNSRFSASNSVELGFYFSQKGSRKNENPKNNDYTFYRANLNYFDMPLSLRHSINEKYFVTLGPSIAYLISYTERAFPDNCPGDCPFNKFEVGINVGLGARIADKITLELRSSNSLTPIRNFGQLANLVYYPNPVARFFNRGLYNNILSLFLAYELHPNAKRSGQ
jgi:hypothetical protein